MPLSLLLGNEGELVRGPTFNALHASDVRLKPCERVSHIQRDTRLVDLLNIGALLSARLRANHTGTLACVSLKDQFACIVLPAHVSPLRDSSSPQ